MTRKNTHVLLFCMAFLALGCGMSVPSSDGKKGSFTVDELPTSTAVIDNAPAVIDNLFIVTADSLQIRPCPYKDDETCPPYQRGFVAGDVVMGFCRTFEDGSIWLEFDGQKYAAVLFDGEWLMEGVCQ